MRDIVRSAISTLNERQRLAVLLSKFESMSYEDIADTMEMSPQAVKSLLSRARSNLREVLEPYLQTGAAKTDAAKTDAAKSHAAKSHAAKKSEVDSNNDE
jgi:RNA polymerase sigma-70 factor (ECF subfamily)